MTTRPIFRGLLFGMLALSLSLAPVSGAYADSKKKRKDQEKEDTVKGALIGAGVGALIGGSKGAVAGGIAGAIIGKNK